MGIFIEEPKCPLISVIVPVYNVKPYLKEALDSVICQTYRNLEIFIIDDGSTDGSGKICDHYLSDSRVTVIHQKNRGLSSARNAGLDNMKGEYVAFLDSDDAYQVSFVEEMATAIVREEADIVVCKYLVHSTVEKLGYKGNTITYPTASPGTYDHITALQALVDSRINFGPWNKLYKSNLWDEIRYPDGHVYEDVDTMYQVFDFCNKTCVIDRPLYLHRNRPGSITDTVSVQNQCH